ncbi:uncharacterized protein LOC143596786 isoform X2 [Bidens hawaiensis]|uniref:uncharacterized protein LOC143596786 isoform X2 n=1 Tax=Bidens hawaiensis TaxID=980011 RepID=UPI00404AD63F
MALRGCSSSHYISCINNGVVTKVHNMDTCGRPSPKFKKLEEINQHSDAENTSPQLADRETRERNSYVAEEYETNFPSKDNNLEELTLSQIKKKIKKKKRKASESVLLTPKAEDDDCDLTEPLFKFRIKGSKSSQSKRVSSRKTQLVTSEPSEDFAFVKVKVEVPEVEYYESSYDPTRGKSESFTNEGEKCERNEAIFDSLDDILEMGDEETIESVNQPSLVLSSPTNDSLYRESTVNESDSSQSQFYLQQTPQQADHISVVQDSDPMVDGGDHDEDVVSMEAKLTVSEEGEKCELNEAFYDSLDDIENMEMDNEETIASDSPQSELYLQQSPKQVYCISAVQDSTLTVDDEHNEDVISVDAKSPNSEENESLASMNTDCSQSELCLQQTPEQVDYISTVQDLTSTIVDEHDEDVVSMEAKSPIFEENESLASMNTDADSNSSSDNVSLVSKGISIIQELISTVPSEVKLDYSDKKSGIRQPERLPLTRKFISPNSQEKLCQAMKTVESLDDMDYFKCKEKLNFGEQAENKFSSAKTDVEDTESNVHSQQASQLIQNKATLSSKHVFKKPRSIKKGSPTKKGTASKGCLDGPRLCRSLPRFSSGCTSIEGCSESAIAFSQRQMHDIESLASKLMSELNSMKAVVEEKMLFEAYRSTSLKNEAGEILQVKSVIKSATKTEETAKKWLSMMARDCNRFCKIMKLNEDNNNSASGDPVLGNINQDKPLEKEKKKISFADEAGGKLCDIKLYQIEEESEASLP